MKFVNLILNLLELTVVKDCHFIKFEFEFKLKVLIKILNTFSMSNFEGFV